MSTSSLAVSLLLLSLLLSQAQGIRLEKGFISVRQQHNNNDNLQEQETASMKRSNNNIAGAGESSGLCKDGGQCSSSSGSTRRLISVTSSSTTTTTTSKNEKKNGRNNNITDPQPKDAKVNTQYGGEDGNVKAKSSVVSKHREAVDHQHYPDPIAEAKKYPFREEESDATVEDMTEMDYSPARRKPPIHN